MALSSIRAPERTRGGTSEAGERARQNGFRPIRGDLQPLLACRSSVVSDPRKLVFRASFWRAGSSPAGVARSVLGSGRARDQKREAGPRNRAIPPVRAIVRAPAAGALILLSGPFLPWRARPSRAEPEGGSRASSPSPPTSTTPAAARRSATAASPNRAKPSPSCAAGRLSPLRDEVIESYL